METIRSKLDRLRSRSARGEAVRVDASALLRFADGGIHFLLAAVDPAVVHGKRIGEYGAEALVDRDRAPRNLLVERPTLEDIILYLAKEEVQ